MGIVSGSEIGSYHIVVVLKVGNDDTDTESTPQILANASAVLEDCSELTSVDWKVEDGIIVLKGWATKPFSVCMAALSADAAMRTRLHHIEYKEARRTQQR